MSGVLDYKTIPHLSGGYAETMQVVRVEIWDITLRRDISNVAWI